MAAPSQVELEFPCQFPVKAMGLADRDIETTVVEIVRRHAPGLGEGAVAARHSRGGKYVSVTVTIEATSRAQLDAIYQDLTRNENVLVAL